RSKYCPCPVRLVQLHHENGAARLLTAHFARTRISARLVHQTPTARAGFASIIPATPATRSYECSRSACSYVSVTTITSSAPVSLASFSSPAFTVASDPTIAAHSLFSTAARSQSCHSGSMESTGGNNSTGWFRISRRKRCCGVVNNRRAAASVSAAIACTPIIRYGLRSTSLGRKCSRYNCVAAYRYSGAKCAANANGNPSIPASCALKPLDPSNVIGTLLPCPGIAFTTCPGFSGPRYVRSSSSSAGKPSPLCRKSLRSARIVWESPPGARPSPRSIRPGYNASSVPNCSATTSGAWFGSITPPLPTRIVFVAAATCPISTGVAEQASPEMEGCSASQERLYPHGSTCCARSTDLAIALPA